MPAGVSVGADNPTTVAMVPGAARLAGEWVGRELASEPVGVGARDSLIRALT